jgi:hypothetical protein
MRRFDFVGLAEGAAAALLLLPQNPPAKDAWLTLAEYCVDSI